MPPIWDEEEPTEVSWSDPDAWRGDSHPEEPGSWLRPIPPFSFVEEIDPLQIEDELLAEDDWCPGGWLEDWGETGER